MAKYQSTLNGEFDELLRWLHEGILGGSISASYEDGADYTLGKVRCAVRVYERYSYLGSNRVSVSVTLLGEDSRLHLTAITSGGSQAVFMKMNTLGESAFLDRVQDIVEEYKSRQIQK